MQYGLSHKKKKLVYTGNGSFHMMHDDKKIEKPNTKNNTKKCLFLRENAQKKVQRLAIAYLRVRRFEKVRKSCPLN